MHYNSINTYIQIYKFKAKDSEINVATLCLGKVLVDNIFYGSVYGFSVDYDSIDVDDTLYIHKYLMKKPQYNLVLLSFAESLVSNSKGRIKCVSLSYRPCQARPKLINPNKPLFYSLTVSVNVEGK